MFDGAFQWILSRGLEIVTLFATFAALFYAHLAYRSSVDAAVQARAAELTSLRIQANAGLSDAQLSLFALEANCQANRSQWASYERQLPPLRPKSMFESWPNAKLQNRARSLLHDLNAAFAAVESMTSLELEKLLQETRNTSLQIRALTSDLESPPNYLN